MILAYLITSINCQNSITNNVIRKKDSKNQQIPTSPNTTKQKYTDIK